MRVALLIDEDEDINDKLNAMSYVPEIVSPYYKLLDKNSVQTLQDRGFRVIPWTVNRIEDMELMIDYQVDAIITDYPDLLINLLK